MASDGEFGGTKAEVARVATLRIICPSHAMCRTILLFALLLGLIRVAPAYETRDVPLADGFDIPVGQNGLRYYKARGVRPNGHLGEDWNGVGGGDTDLGDPIYSSADGIVTFAEDFRLGWGNVVIIRSAYLENGDAKYVDCLYGHLLNFSVKVGQIIKRGQVIAKMGSNRGMYPAHLHFEMRKNINVGMFRSSFPRDWSVYWSPSDFVADHRTCPGGGRIAAVPVGTYPNSPPPIIASTKVYTPTDTIASAKAKGQVVTGGHAVPTKPSPLRHIYASAAPSRTSSSSSSSRTVSTSKPAPRPVATGPGSPKVPATSVQRKVPPRRTLFKVDRFEDMKVLGYE